MHTNVTEWMVFAYQDYILIFGTRFFPLIPMVTVGHFPIMLIEPFFFVTCVRLSTQVFPSFPFCYLDLGTGTLLFLL